MKPCLFFCVLIFVGALTVSATDHTDLTSARGRAPFDITDTFAFPVGEGRLALMMTVRPFANRFSHFKEEVDYVFRLRPAQIGARPGSCSPIRIGNSEVQIVCERKGRDIHTTVIGPDGRRIGDPVVTRFNAKPVAVDAAAPIRVFAGLRAEPFISDFIKVRQKSYPDSVTPSSGKGISVDFFAGAAVLALVVELDVNKILAPINRGRPLLAVGVEAISHAHQTGEENKIVDRQGRVEITQFLVAKQLGKRENKEAEDVWNVEDTFDIGAAKRKELLGMLRAGLEDFDKRDSGDNWRPGTRRTEAFLDLLLDDVLILDLTKPALSGGSAANTYFEIERAALTGRQHRTCGGRAPNDDVIDTTLTLFVRGLDKSDGSRISDGLDRAFKPATDDFPYLAKPGLFIKGKFPPFLR